MILILLTGTFGIAFVNHNNKYIRNVCYALKKETRKRFG